jgi:hypothetical protein
MNEERTEIGPHGERTENEKRKGTERRMDGITMGNELGRNDQGR